MPRAAAAKPSPLETSSLMAELVQSAAAFVAHDRCEATTRKWLPRRPPENESEDRLLAMMADAMLLSVDLLVSQPSASGTTALDRLARSRAPMPADEAAAVGALRQARFRLLSLEGDTQAPDVAMRDIMSDEVLHVVGTDLPPLAKGTKLFGRVAMLGGGLCCLPGAVTPLDPAAFAAAHGHAAAGAAGATAGLRWAEAVYGHVVRHGTLDVPGLNRPSGDFDPDDDLSDVEGGALFALAMDWAELAENPADAALLQRTRQLADLPTMLDAFAAMMLARKAREEAMATAFERALLVQMETVLRREHSGSGTLTLDAVAAGIDKLIAAERLPPAARKIFAGLRQRLAGGSSAHRPGDPALERLVQRIQGLRAKTVAQGCTEQEALAAAEKVADLLDRYGLSLGELDFRAQPCDGIAVQTDRRRFAPIDSCIPTIAAFFDCRVWAEHAKGAALRYVFFGLRGDVAAAQYLYELVERAFKTETDAFRAGDLYAEMAGERRSATTSFQTGLARGICGKLATLREGREANRRSTSGRDLVPVKAAMVDEELAKLGLDLRQRQTARGKRVLADAYAEGEAAGQRFEVTPAITRAA